MPVSLGEMIGSGASSKVYAFGRDKVMKVFGANRDLEHVEREFRNARAARNAGLPVPEAFEVVRLGEGYGVVYERAPGEQLVQFLLKRPWTVTKMARRFARLHLEVLQVSIPGLRWQISHYMETIRQGNLLPFSAQRRILLMLCSLPLDEALCHGDFTPTNIVVTAHDTMMIVDWPNACSGNPDACVANTALTLDSEREDRTRNFILCARLFRRAYLAECLRLRPRIARDFGQWQIVIAATRLQGSELYPPEKERLLAMVSELETHDAIFPKAQTAAQT